MTDLPHTIDGFRAAIARGARPADLVRAVYRRIEAVDDPGIFICVVPEDDAVAAAEALGAPPEDGSRPLHGIPFTVKDNIDVAGLPTTAACPAFAYKPMADATVVARLRTAGALLIGKTNLDQFATGLVGVRTPFEVPRNVRNPAVVPGGSSAGSAVAVAAGIVPFALGTDTAGSGRVPAALNGIVGLKPTLGLVPSTGVVPACRTLDTVSVFARTVPDAHAVLGALAGADPADPFSRPIPLRVPFAPDAVRLGVPSPATRPFFGDTTSERAFAAALERLPMLGITPVEIDFSPFHAVAQLLYEGPWVAERYTVIADLLARSPAAILPVTRTVIGKAEGFSAADAFRAHYRLKALAAEIAALLAAADLAGLLVPSVPTHPTLLAVAEDPVGENTRLGTYTNFVNLLDMAALAVPTVQDGAGRPGSLTLIGPAGADGFLAALGTRIAHDADASAPDLAPQAAPSADEIAIVAVGAHMTGLPLNGELTGRGGRFLRAARTSADYRLYALPGGPPRRPGLVRVQPPSTGAPIAIELWALPREQVGAFLERIPAPLSIGTIALEDGTTAKGFLCEASATAGAADVTRFGGWRPYLASTGG